MRHGKDWRKLGRTASHRRLMLRNLVTSLLAHERVQTTLPRAKEARRWTERMITFGKRGDLHARRQAAAFVRDKDAVKKLFDDIAPRMAERNGGYTRIVTLWTRKGDGAPLAILELVDAPSLGTKQEERRRGLGRLRRGPRPAKTEERESREE